MTKRVPDDKLIPISSHEGVASVYRSKSTYRPFGLACFKLRDSCIAETMHEVCILLRHMTKYSLVLYLVFILGGTKDGVEYFIFL